MFSTHRSIEISIFQANFYFIVFVILVRRFCTYINFTIAFPLIFLLYTLRFDITFDLQIAFYSYQLCMNLLILYVLFNKNKRLKQISRSKFISTPHQLLIIIYTRRVELIIIYYMPACKHFTATTTNLCGGKLTKTYLAKCEFRNFVNIKYIYILCPSAFSCAKSGKINFNLFKETCK